MHLENCPKCGFDILTVQQRVMTMADDFRQFCLDNNWTIYPGNRVDEDTAAKLIGVQVRTLRNRRSDLTGPKYIKVGGITYRLYDIAIFMLNYH